MSATVAYPENAIADRKFMSNEAKSLIERAGKQWTDEEERQFQLLIDQVAKADGAIVNIAKKLSDIQ